MQIRRFSSDLQRRHNGDVIKTDDEIVWGIFNDIIILPEEEYKMVCDYMMEKELIPGLAEEIIHKADEKRKEIAAHIAMR